MEFFRLMWGTILNRPYVDGFFVCYLVFSFYLLGRRRTVAFLAISFLLALACELSATRWGFPFGKYVYIDTTRTQELWISNVPSWDSLSFVFLSFFSWILAGALRARSWRAADIQASLRSPRTLLLGGLLMMLLDVVIDPLTLLGDRWFLGKIYYYPDGGPYFGVTITNFAGWWFVGAVIPWLYQRFIALEVREVPRFFYWGVFGVYAGVFLFNLGITAYIREWTLLAASSAVVVVTLAASAVTLKSRSADHGTQNG